MKLYFKNKYLMMVSEMVEAGIKKGGIPHEIRLNLLEAQGILKEIRALKNEELENPGRKGAAARYCVQTVLASISIVPKDPLENLQDPEHPSFLIAMVTGRKVQQLHEKTLDALILAWNLQTINVAYHHDNSVVPLVIERTPV